MSNLFHEYVNIFKKVFSNLRRGFSENIYQNAIKKELRDNDIKFSTEQTIDILYNDYSIGTFRPDLIINDNRTDHVLVELKVGDKFSEDFQVQCVMYLRCLAQSKTTYDNIQHAILVIYPKINKDLLIYEFKRKDNTKLEFSRVQYHV